MRRFLGPTLIAIAFIIMAAWTWKTWPNPLVDYGMEPYRAWRVSLGERLYRDVAHFKGPLSPYMSALWFRLFGVSLLTLMWVNLVTLALFVTLLYALLRAASDALAATVACLAFVVLFAFAQFVGLGNYNYVTPYSQEVVHGVVLSTIAIACAWRYQRHRHGAWALGCGLAIGLAALTDAQVCLAGAVAAIAIIILARPNRRGAAMFVAGALLPLIAAWTLLGMPAFNAWRYSSDSRVVALPFFREVMGLDAPAANVGRLLVVAAWAAGIVLVAVGAAIFGRNIARHRPGRNALLATILVCLTIAAFATLPRGPWWTHVGRPLPMVMIVVVIALAISLWRERREPNEFSRITLRFGLALFGLALLSKMALNARIYHYGFVLAMPATLVTILALLGWLPARLRAAGANACLYLAVVLATIGCIGVAYIRREVALISQRRAVIGHGTDAFYATPRIATPINQALAVIDGFEPGATIVVLPEGVMLNFLARRATPTKYVNFTPIDTLIWGEDDMLAALKAHPPDYVVLAHSDTSAFGAPFFGRDYGLKIMSWVNDDYERVQRFGDEPLVRKDTFGIVILKRRAVTSR